MESSKEEAIAHLIKCVEKDIYYEVDGFAVFDTKMAVCIHTIYDG